MKIAIIGAGNVGGALAYSLGKKGHSIFIGSRNPQAEDIKELTNSIGLNASAHYISEAIVLSDVVILATPWSVTQEVVEQYQTELAHKILIDCTNPLKKDLSGLEIGHNESGAELLQKCAPGAYVFKAFNTTGFNIMQNPLINNQKAIMYYCGDHHPSRNIVRELVQDVGFEALDAGPLTSARLLEPFALLWIQSAYKFGLGRDFAFTILRK